MERSDEILAFQQQYSGKWMEQFGKYLKGKGKGKDGFGKGKSKGQEAFGKGDNDDLNPTEE